MAQEVIFRRIAALEYRRARDWYRERSVGVAARFVNAVDRAVQRIEAGGDALPTYLNDYRFVRVGRFPYLLAFKRISPTEFVVVAVAHTSRRFGYWRRRN